MNDFLSGLLTALLATNAPVAVSNYLSPKIHAIVKAAADPSEKELEQLMAQDDQARAEVDEILQEGGQSDIQKPELRKNSTQERMEAKLGPVKKAYEAFLERHPRHAQARIAYGSFLSEIHEEEEGAKQWIKAKELAPDEPAAWNNLANYYGHRGPVTNALTHYARAIELNPAEPVYFQNMAATMYLFRADSAAFLKKTVPEVMDAAMAMYRRALALDPGNFKLATDLAQSFYGLPGWKGAKSDAEMKLQRRISEDALNAWTNAYRLAGDDIERQGVRLHFARLSLHLGRKPQAQAALDSVTNAMFTPTKSALQKKLQNPPEPGNPLKGDGETKL